MGLREHFSLEINMNVLKKKKRKKKWQHLQRQYDVEGKL